jgi:hypothetical protein
MSLILLTEKGADKLVVDCIEMIGRDYKFNSYGGIEKLIDISAIPRSAGACKVVFVSENGQSIPFEVFMALNKIKKHSINDYDNVLITS